MNADLGRSGDARPPTPVTVENWQDPGLVGWSFQHLDEIVPTARIPRGPGPAAELPRAPLDLSAVDVPLPEGATRSVAEVVAATDTDGWMVLHRGHVVAEEYVGSLGPATRHLLMSVSKSLVSTVTGILVDRGAVDTDAPVTDYVPELARSGYAGATVRHLLDMRSGVTFSEDYLDPDSEVRLLDAACGWGPPRRDRPRTIKSLLQSLGQGRPHGGPFASPRSPRRCSGPRSVQPTTPSSPSTSRARACSTAASARRWPTWPGSGP
jgi:hypothetical protein